MMPTGGAEHRANQSAQLAGLAHERATRPRIGELFELLKDEAALGGPNSTTAANVREARRKYVRASKLSQSLVEELSRCATMAQQAWVGAKKAQSFSQFLPWLEKTIQLKREEAQAVGAESGVLYDACSKTTNRALPRPRFSRCSHRCARNSCRSSLRFATRTRNRMRRF